MRLIPLVLWTACLVLFCISFLLNRKELGVHSSCTSTPSKCQPLGDLHFDRVTVVLIDALRHDFAAYNDSSDEEFSNRLVSMHSALHQHPHKSNLYRFRADAPTVTMQRVKALTTGLFSISECELSIYPSLLSPNIPSPCAFLGGCLC